MKTERTGCKILRVAAVQTESKPGRIEENREHVLPWIEEAAGGGARLIVLPELFASGYCPSREIWRSAETERGGTVEWLRRTAKRLGVYLGAGMILAEAADFYNAFFLAGPDGGLSGKAIKENAESYVFRRGRGAHVIDTPLGKLGVGICADNHYTRFVDFMRAQSISLMLMPHAWPTPFKAQGMLKEEDVENQNRESGEFASFFSRMLGVPSVFVNAVGPLHPMTGLTGKLMNPEFFRLRGNSTIADAAGEVKASAGMDRETVIAADVALDPGAKWSLEPANYGGWLNKGSALLRKVIMPADILAGSISYGLSPLRKRLAGNISKKSG